MDRNLNELLKWSIENSTHSEDVPEGTPSTLPEGRALDRDAVAALFGGPSDAELMRAAMSVITSTDPEVSQDDKLVAFDNFEQLIESLDNANNLANLSLWSPLLLQLEHADSQMRRMAAWCVGTAVQNNAPAQERLLALGGLPRLVRLATAEGEPDAVRRKAVYALSSAVRNYQPAMDAAAEELARRGVAAAQGVDASNMDAVDSVIEALQARPSGPASA